MLSVLAGAGIAVCVAAALGSLPARWQVAASACILAWGAFYAASRWAP